VIDVVITDIIMRYIRANRKYRAIGVYYPSELFWCLRRVYYDYTIGKDRDLETILKMMAGSVTHNMIAEILKWASSVGAVKSVDTEIGCEYEFNGIKIAGRVDEVVVITLSDFDEKCVVEVKSVSGLPDKPRMEHIGQLNFYLYFNRDAKGYLLYINRSDFSMKSFEYRYDENLFAQLLSRAEKLHRHLVSGVLPDREVSHGECWKCVYRNICYSSG